MFNIFFSVLKYKNNETSVNVHVVDESTTKRVNVKQKLPEMYNVLFTNMFVATEI